MRTALIIGLLMLTGCTVNNVEPESPTLGDTLIPVNQSWKDKHGDSLDSIQTYNQAMVRLSISALGSRLEKLEAKTQFMPEKEQ